MKHFVELRNRINAKLEEIHAPHREAQITEYEWLHGALGEVPSDVMFICENPSAAGVARAQIDTVDGGAPDIEAQWWGGRKNPAAKRFRVALHRLGLKTSPPTMKGGWRCYITNVIKEMNVVGDHRKLRSADYREMARTWAPILQWEINQVRPAYVFTVGHRAHDRIRSLVRERAIQLPEPKLVNHYSSYATDEAVIDGIVQVVRTHMASQIRENHRTGGN
jgi:hypothetical protein